MADNGIRALPPVGFTPTTSYTNMLSVPSGKEWTVRFLRALTTGAGSSTVSVDLGTDIEIAFEEILMPSTSDTPGAKNILGPDFIILPPGSVVRVKGTSNAIRVVASVTERDL